MLRDKAEFRRLSRRRRVLIDCDPGIDDALALFFAFASDRLEIEAITTVFGNADVRQCTDNLIKILDISGLKRIPEIGIGSDRPLVEKRLEARATHGRNGLGDIRLDPPKNDYSVNDAIELAASKILTKKIDYIIATGPLTNIARIIAKSPRIVDLVKRIYIMGGALFVKGSVTPYAEFNIYSDPHAAKMIFDSKIPKTLVSLDVTEKVILKKRDLERFEKDESRISRFIVDIADYAISHHRNIRRAEGAYMHDPLCVGVAIDDEICEYSQGYAEVTESGPERGRVVISKKNRGNRASNITYCKRVNSGNFKELFLGHLMKLAKEAAN